MCIRLKSYVAQIDNMFYLFFGDPVDSEQLEVLVLVVLEILSKQTSVAHLWTPRISSHHMHKFYGGILSPGGRGSFTLGGKRDTIDGGCWTDEF